MPPKVGTKFGTGPVGGRTSAGATALALKVGADGAIVSPGTGATDCAVKIAGGAVIVTLTTAAKTATPTIAVKEEFTVPLPV